MHLKNFRFLLSDALVSSGLFFHCYVTSRILLPVIGWYDRSDLEASCWSWKPASSLVSVMSSSRVGPILTNLSPGLPSRLAAGTVAHADTFFMIMGDGGEWKNVRRLLLGS